MTIRNSDLPTGKIAEGLFNQHAKEARRKLEGNKKFKHKTIADDMSAVSCIHSNVSRALRVRMPIKPKKTIVTAPLQPPTETVTDFAPPMTLPQTSIVIAEPLIRPKRKAASKATEALQPSQKRKRSSPTQTCPPTVSSTSAPSRQKRRQMNKQQQIKNKSILSTIQKTAARDQNEETNFSVGPCTAVQMFPRQYCVSQKYEGPQHSMTVREAECAYESESDEIKHFKNIIVLFIVTSTYFINFLINILRGLFLLRRKCDIVIQRSLSFAVPL